jgi:small subunit ribosomal protein S13
VLGGGRTPGVCPATFEIRDPRAGTVTELQHHANSCLRTVGAMVSVQLEGQGDALTVSRCLSTVSVSQRRRSSKYVQHLRPPQQAHRAHRESNTLQRSLESFFGIGPKVSQKIMARFHIHPWAKVGALKNATVMDLTAELSTMKIENDARREVQDNIRRLKDMGTYRGRRHAMGLPVRGQRTRTQINTARRLNKVERGGSGRVQM